MYNVYKGVKRKVKSYTNSIKFYDLQFYKNISLDDQWRECIKEGNKYEFF